MKYKKFLLLGLLFTLLAGLASAYNVTGRVSESGTGVENIRVTINGKADLTDSSGDYIIGEINNGTYTYYTMKSGYRDTSGSVTVSGNTEKNLTVSKGLSWTDGKENVEGAMDLFIAFVGKIPTIIMYLFIIIVLLAIAYAIKKFSGNIGEILNIKM